MMEEGGLGEIMKKLFTALVAVVGIGFLLFYGFKLFNGTDYQEEDGTNTNAASKEQDEFFVELEEYYPDLFQVIAKDHETYVVPGLVQKESVQAKGEDKGVADQTEDMTPQGLSFAENFVIISAYSASYSHNSVLWFLDRESGDYLKTIVLPTTSHVGGIAYDTQHERLWITTTDKDSSSQISALDLETLNREDFSKSQKEVTFDQQYDLDNIEKSSYMSYYDNHLLVGYFDKDEKGHLGIFDLDNQGLLFRKKGGNDGYQPKRVIDTLKKIQGVAVGDKEIIFSQSYGKDDSKLLFFAFDNLDNLGHLDQEKDIEKDLAAPPYMQQIVAEEDGIYLLFESSAFKYRLNPTVTSVDRVLKITVD